MDDLIPINGKLTGTSGNGVKEKDQPRIKGMAEEIEDLNEQSRKMQQLIEQVDGLPESSSTKLLHDCINEILTFYGNGLERIMNVLVNQTNTTATKVLNDLIEDSFINGLLILHGLHPLDIETRLNLALEKVRPYIESHGGILKLLSLEDGVAKIKLAGTCKTCASSSVTLELAIKQAIEESCPDLLQLDVEGIESLSNGHELNDKKEADKVSRPTWRLVNDINNLANEETRLIEINNISVVICKLDEQLYAYKNNCPACDLPLNDGRIEEGMISCRLGHLYDIKHAGACPDNYRFHLDPIPLLQEKGVVKIAIS